MTGSEHLTTQIAMGRNGSNVKKITSMLALMSVLTSLCSGQIILETNLTSVIIEKNRVRTSSDYVYRDANDDDWQTQLALAQSQAEQAATSTTESNLWVSGTAISFTQSGYYKNLAGKIYRVYAAYVQRDQDLTVDLSSFGEANGYSDAKFVWEIGHGESTAEAFVARQYDLHENAHTYEFPLVLGGTNELTIELEPWWVNYKGHAGIGPNDDPRHVTIRQQLLEAPRQCLIPQAAEAGEAKLINTITGNESLRRVDIHVPTPGIPLEFTREYHSLSPNGWVHNYGMTLTNKTTVFQGTTNDWKVLSAGPAMWHFKQSSSNEYDSPLGTSYELDILSNGNALVQFDYATTALFDTNGVITQLASVTNANGHYVGYDYDSYGCLKEIDPQAGPAITLSNNVLGHLVKIELPGWEGSTTPGGSADPRVIELEPDGLGQVGKITYPDELEETFTYDGLGNLVTNVDRAGRMTVYTYEPLGRLSSAARYLVEGTSTQDVTIAFGYDQQFNTLEITDPLNREVEAYQLDDLGRAVSITNVDDQVMTVDYGVADYVNSITRFDDSEVLFTYGLNGLLASAVYDDETLEFKYFDNDLLKIAENSEASITNSYNSVNRLTNVVTVAGSVTSEVAYTYLSAGQVSNMTTEAGAVTFSYDAAERVTDIVDSEAGSFEYAYNTNNGLVKTVEYPNDVSCSLDYDVMDRLTAISWTGPGGTLHGLSYQYNAAGMITNRVEESPSGTRNSAFTYDSLDRLTGETYSDGLGTVFDEVGYEYDLAGNRTNKTHNGVTVSFELGAGNRMTNWTAQVSTNAEAVMYVAGYSSEDIGTDPRYGEWTVNDEDAEVSGTNFWSTTVFSDLSQTSQTVIAAMGDEAGNVGRDTNTWTLTIISDADYSYDDAGNVTEIAYNTNLLVRTLGWDDQYQLTAASNGTSEVESYTYGPFGRRLTTTQGTNTTTHLYDGIHCIADVDGDGDVLRSYTYGPGVDNPLAMTVFGDETNTYCYLTDHLGSVLALTDEDGELVEAYEYDAFGRIKVFGADFEEIPESAYGNRITFQGKEYSWETGLYYFRARWYEPVTGRWLSKDPIGISGGLNQYVAFENNPILFADPDGLSAEALALGGLLEWSGGGAAAGGAAVGAGAVGAGLLAGATGVAGGMAIDRYWDYMTGESLSDRIGDWIGDLITPVLTPEEIADLIIPAETISVCGDIIILPFADEHTKNKRPSTRERHEGGRRRIKKDKQGGEKGDVRRPYRRGGRR